MPSFSPPQEQKNPIHPLAFATYFLGWLRVLPLG